MSLLGPDDHDKRKIHSEVNQIVNQRLAITTLAITVSIAVVAWLVPKTTPPAGSEIGSFVFIASTLLTLVLLALFFLMHLLSQMLRIFTSYLEVTGKSQWEQDWSKYRDTYSYFGYTRSQSIIFLLLGFISAGFPYLLCLAYNAKIEPLAGAITSTTAGAIYLFLVSGMGLIKWGTRESEFKRRWNELKNQTEQSEESHST
jgi:hypothetical protein